MRTVLVTTFGSPDAYEVIDAPTPEVGAHQILVRLKVSGLNYLDVYQRIGMSPLKTPFSAGVEGVGVIEAIGSEVRGFTTGQRVGWLTGGQGSFSELALVAAEKLVSIPDHIDDVTAAAVLMQGVTAHYLASDCYDVNHGDVAMVHAAAGGVGLLLSQILKMKGAVVIGTTSSASKAEVARQYGADHVFGYDNFADEVKGLTGGAGAHVVYDGVGASTFEGSLASLRVRGTLVLFGAASGPVPPFDVSRLAAAGSLFLTRPTVVHYTATPEELQGRTSELFAWVAGGQLKTAAPTAFPVSDIAEAFNALESRRTTGKVVLLH